MNAVVLTAKNVVKHGTTGTRGFATIADANMERRRIRYLHITEIAVGGATRLPP